MPTMQGVSLGRPATGMVSTPRSFLCAVRTVSAGVAPCAECTQDADAVRNSVRRTAPPVVDLATGELEVGKPGRHRYCRVSARGSKHGCEIVNSERVARIRLITNRIYSRVYAS